jgi:4-amino-4-deoxy-L-arabinose transferase-like glycosyltransferase
MLAKEAQRWLFVFILAHLLVWTLAPYIIRYTLPMDAIEGFIWGQHFEWGYDKNPFLNGWITGLAVRISGCSAFAVYLCSQLSVAICFWAIWNLAKQMLTPMLACASVLILECIQYYNLHAIDFNDNTLELSCWAITCLTFYNALHSTRRRDWVMLGLAAGVAMMAKYYSALLLIAMLLFLIIPPANRRYFKKPHLYLALITFVAVILPHCIWLCFHNFITVRYAFARVENTQAHHFYYTLLFIKQQLVVLIPFLLIFPILFIGKRQSASTQLMKPFDKQFITYLAFGPLLFTILLAAITGMKLRAGWGQPLFSLLGVAFIGYLKPPLTLQRFHQFVFIIYSLMLALAIGYCLALYHGKLPSSANFPARTLTQKIVSEWENKYHQPLPYIVGSRWVAGNIGFYATVHPVVFINWDLEVSTWIDEADVRRKGAIFMWDTLEDDQQPISTIQQHFPTLLPVKQLDLHWLRNDKLTPVTVKFAILPPAVK